MPNDTSLTDSQLAAVAAAAEVSQPVEQSGATADVTAVVLGGTAAGNFSIAASSELAADLRPRLGAVIGAAQAAIDRTFSGDMLDSIVGEAFGRSVADTDAFRAAVQQLRESWSQGGLVIAVEVRPAADLQGHPAAYAAANADGAERIYVNAEWLASVDGAAGAAVLLEEFGHAIDRRINAGIDSPGDEGELFADLVEGRDLDSAEIQRVGGEDDAGMLAIDGAAVAVEFAARNISSVTIPDGVNGYFVTGENVDVSVTFSGSVNVNTSGGTPSLTIRVGSTNRTASYVSGSGTSTLVFRYTIQSGESDADGISISSGSISLNSGTIKNGSDNATLTFSAVSANSNAKVFNGSRPTLTTMSTLTGATEDTAFEILYTALTTAGNEANTTSFLIDSVTSGTLSKWNGTSWVAVTAGTTTIATGEKLQWTPAANANGTLNAFTVKASNGTLASSSAVQVQVTVAAVNDAPTLVLTGTAIRGQVLTATLADSDGLPGSISRKWQRSTDGGATWSDIAGATAATYTLASADVGLHVRSTASFTDLQAAVESLASAASSRISQAYSLTSADSDLSTLLQGSRFDPVDDTQSNAADTDLVGGAATPMLLGGYDSANDVMYLRVRIGDPTLVKSGGVDVPRFDGVLLIGLDVNRDGALDIMVGVDGRNGGQGVVMYDPGTGSNTSPSTTSITNQTAAWTSADGTLVYDTSARASGDAGGTYRYELVPSPPLDMGGDGGVDAYLTFKVSFSAVAARVAQAGGGRSSGMVLTEDSTLRFAVFTLTQNNSINGDIGGIGGSRSDLDRPWSEITDPISFVVPTLGGFAKVVQYLEQSPAVAVAPSGTLTDLDNPYFSGGRLRVAFASGTRLPEDSLTVISGAAGVTVSGTSLTYGGTVIGSFAWNGVGAPGELVVDFAGSNVSIDAVNAVLRSVGYANSSATPATSRRSLSFTVTDPDGNVSDPASCFVDVVPVNDAPAGADKTVTIAEDGSYTFAASDFGFTDSNDSPANSLLAVKIATLPAAGTLKLNGTNVTVGQIVAVADITGNKLVYAPAANANGTGYASFTFQVQDNGGTANGGVDLDQSTNTLTVNVTSVNDAPTGTDKTIAVLEDGSYTFSASDFGFSDTSDSPANSLAAVKIATLPAAGTLKLDGVAVTAGDSIAVADLAKLVFTPAANANGTGYASFTFQVQDNGGTSNGGVDLDQSANTITIDVTSVNDAPAGTDKTVTIDEDGSYTFAASDFGFSDPNDSPANSLAAVKIATLPAAGTLKLDGVAVAAGDFVAVADLAKLVYAPAANANGTGYASFTFQVQDNGGTSNGGVDLDQSANTITIDVTSVNDAPAGTDKTVTIDEDGSYTFSASDFGFTDSSDSPANSLAAVKIATLPAAGTLKLDGVAVTAGDSIAVADLTKLVFTPAANANGTGYSSFTFQVQDNGGTANGGVDLDQSSHTITIDVTSVNDAPAGADKTVTIDEDGSHTFSSSDFGFSDASDSPANSLAAVKIATLPAAGTLKLNGTNVAAGDSIAVADLAKLVFTPSANANGTGYSSFTFQVQDNGGTANVAVDLDASANTITIDVTSVNDAPAGADTTVTIEEDGSYTFSASDFGFTDSSDSPANSLAAVKIATLPAAGTLKLDGVAVAAGDSIAIADLAKLVFTPAANANGTGYTSFTFQVQDNGGTANGGVDLDASANTITVNVTSVNDAPAGTDKTVTIDEDGSYTFAASDFGFSDSNDNPSNSLAAVKIATLPAAGTLKLDGVAVTVGQSIAVADLAKLVFTPAANANGTGYASFTFQVQDNGGTANGGVDLDQSANAITVNVTSVNDAPAGTDKTITVLEDGSYTFSATDFGFSDTNDSPANSLTAVKITTLPAAGTLKLDGVAVTAGQSIAVADLVKLVLAPAANANGSGYASFTFQVQDNGGTVNGGVDLDQSAKTITVNVTSVNDAPAAADTTVTIEEDGSYTFSASDFGFTDSSDSPANSLAAVKIATLPSAGSLKLDGVAVAAGDAIAVADLAKLVFTPAANANGTGYASFAFQVQDNGGTANVAVDLDQSANTITIDVTSVNDAPVVTSNGGGTTAAVTIPENTTAVTTVVTGDVDAGSTLTYSIVGGADAAKFQIDPVTGVLSFKVAPDYENPTDAGGDNVYDVVVQVSDGTLVDTQAIAVTVTDVDEILDVGPLDMTDATDDGASQDDEITSNGFPVVFFKGETGLRITLLGPQGMSLTEGSHYSLSYDAGPGTYTITLLDADPATPGAQPFGTFPAGVFGNTPANTADGFYTVVAEDLAGNRGTVGRFQIDTEGDGLPTNSEDTASGGTLVGGAPAQQGDANGDGVIDSIQNNVATAPLLDPAAFDAAKAGDVAPTVVFGSVVADDSSSDGRPDADRTQLKDLVVAALTPDAVAAIQATGGEPLTSRIGFTASPKTGEPAFVDADPVRPGVQQRYTINLGGAGVGANRFVKVRDDGTVFDFTADGNMNTFDEGADLIDLDNDGDVDRIVITVTDNGAGDFDSRANVIRDPGALVYDPRPTTDLQVSITDGQATYIPGSQLTYTVTVTNAGPSLVTGAMVDVPLPVGAVRSSWTATVGSAVVASGTGAIRQAVNLASNASAVFTVVVDVSRTATAGVAALASVSAPDGTDELNPDDNAAIDADTVLLPTSIVLGSDVGCKSMSTVRVLDVQTGEIREFTPYESRFIGGIRVATADLTGDSIDEIIVAPGRGRIGEIRVFTQWGYELPQYRTIAFPGFTGGVEVGVGDVTGDGQADIVVSMSSGRSEVRVFQVNPSNLADPVADRAVLAFQPFGPRFAGGATVAVADVGRFENGVTKDVTAGDGRRELVVGSGAGMAATVQVYDLSGPRPRLVDTINPFRGASTVGALTLAVGRFDGDTIDDIIISSGQGGRSALEVYSGRVDDRQDLRLLALVPFAVTAQRNAAVSAVGVDVDQDGRIDFLAAGQGMGGNAGMLRPISLTGSILSQTAFTQSLPPTPLRVAALNNRPLPVAVTGRNAWLVSQAGAGSLSAKQAAFAAIGTALRGVHAGG